MIKKLNIRQRYRYDSSTYKGLDFSDSPSLTKQEYKEECDIVKQIKKLAVYGDSSGLIQNNDTARYIDCSNIPDFITAQNTVIKATEMFNSLSSEVRKEFDNDPAELLKFVSDDKNYEKAVKLGLVEPKKFVESSSDTSVQTDSGSGPEPSANNS